MSAGDWNYPYPIEGRVTVVATLSALDTSLRIVDALTAYAQALCRRFTHSQGYLWYRPLDGYDLGDLINETGITDEEIMRDVTVQARRDMRTKNIEVKVSRPREERIDIRLKATAQFGTVELAFVVGT